MNSFTVTLIHIFFSILVIIVSALTLAQVYSFTQPIDKVDPQLDAAPSVIAKFVRVAYSSIAAIVFASLSIVLSCLELYRCPKMTETSCSNLRFGRNVLSGINVFLAIGQIVSLVAIAATPDGFLGDTSGPFRASMASAITSTAAFISGIV